MRFFFKKSSFVGEMIRVMANGDSKCGTVLGELREQE